MYECSADFSSASHSMNHRQAHLFYNLLPLLNYNPTYLLSLYHILVSDFSLVSPLLLIKALSSLISPADILTSSVSSLV